MMNDDALKHYCNAIAENIAIDAADYVKALAEAHKSADNAEYGTNRDKAYNLYENCNIDEGEKLFFNCAVAGNTKPYDEMIRITVYGEIRARIEARLYEIFEEQGETS